MVVLSGSVVGKLRCCCKAACRACQPAYRDGRASRRVPDAHTHTHPAHAKGRQPGPAAATPLFFFFVPGAQRKGVTREDAWFGWATVGSTRQTKLRIMHMHKHTLPVFSSVYHDQFALLKFLSSFPGWFCPDVTIVLARLLQSISLSARVALWIRQSTSPSAIPRSSSGRVC